MLLYPVGLMLGLGIIKFEIRFTFDVLIIGSTALSNDKWRDRLFATKKRLDTFEKQHNLPISLSFQILIFVYLLYHFRFSSFYYEIFIPTFFSQ
jgi:hypothetical protein